MVQNQKHIRQCVDRILESSAFSKSTVNRELLKYLVRASLNGENPKEIQIAADVFGRKMDDGKELNIRVYIHNLRKKINEYYQSEGRNDEFVLELPKGEYRVQFHYSPIRLIRKKLLLKAPAALAISFVLLLLSVFTALYFPFRTTTIDFWKPFTRKDYPVFLVLGDHYFFHSQVATGRVGTVRDNQINSDDDYERFLELNPSKMGEMAKSDITYINNQAPIGLFYIMNILGGEMAQTVMDYSSRVRMEDFRGHHVIFIGSFKTLRFLVPSTEKMGIKYHIDKRTLEYQVNDSILEFDNRSDNYLNYEYASVAGFVTNDGRRILFFLCDNDIGNIALVKYFTDKAGIQPFETAFKKLGRENFKGVFEVKGQRRTDFEIKLIRLDALPDHISEIWP
ncbi:helix-turn-helix domain-containing protein [Gaoshiqia sp. Z1-71]|uniref:helix-turn-helix domain-containing protein n=1 Tax=Gaoshiqia hydrogeniformans TaxID=3290090 RepID=UPI003BF8A6D4